MITVTFNENNKSVDFYFDDRGLELLKRKLESLSSDMSHVHIYETNDDRGLSSKALYGEKITFNEVVINLVPADAWE